MNTKMNVAEFVTVALATENPEGATLRDIRRKVRDDFGIRFGYVDIRALLDGSPHVALDGGNYKLPGATKPEVPTVEKVKRGRKVKLPLVPVGPFLPDMKNGAAYL